MRAVVLVGGFGTRLRPLTLTRPKQMLPVVGRPMIERVLSHLATYGITEAVLALGYRPDAFMEHYPEGRVAGVEVVYAVESEPLDTAGAIRFAAAEAGITERFLAVNGDVLTDVDLSALIAFHDQAGAEGTLYLTPVEDPSHYGVVPTDDRGRVLDFIEKPPAGEAPTNLINGGFYVLEASVLEHIAPGRRVNIERETFPALAARGALFARADDAYWLDVGTPERYLQASLDLLDGRRSAIEPSGSDPTTGPGSQVDRSWIGADVSVGAGAVVRRSALGPGVVVGPGATVEDSVVLAGASLGERAVVVRSMLGVSATVGAGARVEDLSVIGDGSVVDEGAQVSGRRLPEEAS